MSSLNEDVVRAIEERRHALCESAVRRQYALQPEIWEPYGEQGLRKSIRDADHHFSYLIEYIAQNDPAIFAAYIAWLKGLFQGLKFPQEALPVMLECTRKALQEHLPQPIWGPADRCIDAALTEWKQSTAGETSFLSEQAPLHELAKQYQERLLAGDRHAAARLILGAAEDGVPLKDIYLHVFQRSQYEIGRLWHSNKVTVAQEHFCSAATQVSMAQLYPYVFSAEKIAGRFVGTCVGGELHEIGIRMVADFFEMEGWNTYYLGSNTPAPSVVSAVEDFEADILGISATMPFHRSALADLIKKVRETDSCKDVKILIGGYSLRNQPDVWRHVGADGFAPDAQGAVSLASDLVTGSAAQ